MLVSSIARFNAISTMHNSANNIMNIHDRMTDSISNRAFGGEHSLEMLHEMDKRNSLDLLTNILTYQLAYFQNKMLEKQTANEVKSNRLNIFG